MGLHISSHSRFRFDFPAKRGLETDCSARDKTGVPGPFTRAQMVELLWRVKEIRLRASGTYSVMPFDYGGLAPLTGSIEVDATMIRTKDNANYAVATELDVFRNMMTADALGSGKSEAYWRGYGATGNGAALLSFPRSKMLKDAGGYWLFNAIEAVLIYWSCSAILTKTISWPAVNNSETGEDYEAGTASVVISVFNGSGSADPVAATLAIGGASVPFPLGVNVSGLGDGGAVTSASIEITKWFKYATTA